MDFWDAMQDEYYKCPDLVMKKMLKLLKKETQMDKNYMATDNFGNTYHNLGPHPRKELLRRLGMKKAHKIYVYCKEGKIRHTGWVIGKFWLTVMEVSPISQEE